MRRFGRTRPPGRAELIVECLGGIRRPGPAIAVVRGPVGSGKSSFLAEVAAPLEEEMRVVGPLDGTAPLVMSELALGLGLGADAPAEAILDRFVEHDGEPVVVIVDDLDQGSNLLGEVLAAAIRVSNSVQLVVSMRAGAGGHAGARAVLRETERGIDDLEIVLDPLGAADVELWIRRATNTETEPSPAEIAALMRWTGGVPALVDLVVTEGLRRDERDPLAAIAADGFAPAVRSGRLEGWVVGLPPETASVVEAVCLIDSALPEEVAEVLDLDPDRVDDAVQAASDAGLVVYHARPCGDVLRPVARALRDAVVAGVPRSRRRRVLGRFLQPGHRDPIRLAHWIMQHGDVVALDDRHAAALLDGARSIAVTDPARAATWARRARTIQPDTATPVGAEALRDALRHESLAGAFGERHTPTMWQRIADPATRDATLAMTVFAAFFATDWYALLDHAQSARLAIAADPQAWPSARGAVIVGLMAAGRGEAATELFDHGDGVHWRDGAFDDLARRVISTLEGSPDARVPLPLPAMGGAAEDQTRTLILETGELTRVLALEPLQALRAKVGRLRSDPMLRDLPMLVDALLIAESYDAFLDGRWEALDGLRARMGAFPLALGPWESLAHAREVRRDLPARAVDYEPGIGSWSGFTAGQLAERLRRDGQPEKALALAEGELAVSQRPPDQVFVADSAIAAARDLGDRVRMEALAGHLDGLDGVLHRAVAMRWRAVLAAEVGLALDAVAMATTAGHGYEILRSQVMAVGMGAYERDEVDAIHERALALGDTSVVAELQAAMRLRSIPVRRASGSGRELSAVERSLCRLVGDGWTNAQIAAELDMSPFTVGNRLRALYRRFGVANRAGLAVAVADLGTD